MLTDLGVRFDFPLFELALPNIRFGTETLSGKPGIEPWWLCFQKKRGVCGGYLHCGEGSNSTQPTFYAYAYIFRIKLELVNPLTCLRLVDFLY